MGSDGELEKFLQEHQWTRYIRLQWIDYSGVLRARFVPVDRCKRIAQGKEHYLLPQVSMIFPVSTGPSPINDSIEKWLLRPDWSSLRSCGFRPSHASVMCYLEHEEAEDTYDKCPRTLLTRAMEQLEGLGVGRTTIMAGLEIEVMLLDEKCQPLTQLDHLSSYQTTAGLRGQTLDIVEEIIDCFTKSSIDVHHFHTETRHQIEFALSPEPLLKAIDSFVLAQETIRTVFIRHNIKATMTPKPLLAGPTNGVHLHMSVDKLEPPHTDEFLAGILHHMRPLCAFGMANFDGYVRTGTDAAGAWVGFGTENRDLPLRKVSDQHWEFRMMDSTSNPYLFAAVVVLAGLDGIKTRLNLSWKDCQVFPNSLDQEGRARYGLKTRMPGSLQEALESLKAEESFNRLIPEGLLQTYMSVKEKDVEVFQKMTDAERRLRFLEFF